MNLANFPKTYDLYIVRCGYTDGVATPIKSVTHSVDVALAAAKDHLDESYDTIAIVEGYARSGSSYEKLESMSFFGCLSDH